MGIQATTARDAGLSAMRAGFLARHRVKEYKLSGHNLMRMVRDAGGFTPEIERVRDRFVAPGGWLRWPGPTWDHMECFGRDRMPLMFVSHPYQIDGDGQGDIGLFRAAGLNVVIGSKDHSWYSPGTYHVRVEHPSIAGGWMVAGSLRPADARKLALVPALVREVEAKARELAEAAAMLPCIGGHRGSVPCIRCEMGRESDRLLELLWKVSEAD